MTLDDKGREDLFALLVQRGYTDTFDQWWSAVRQQCYESEARMAQTVWVASLGEAYQHAQDYVAQLFSMAVPRFDAIVSETGWDLRFSLYQQGARRQASQPKPLRLTALIVSILRKDDHVLVGVSVYVNAELRRGWTVRFNPSQKGQRIS